MGTYEDFRIGSRGIYPNSMRKDWLSVSGGVDRLFLPSPLHHFKALWEAQNGERPGSQVSASWVECWNSAFRSFLHDEVSPA